MKLNELSISITQKTAKANNSAKMKVFKLSRILNNFSVSNTGNNTIGVRVVNILRSESFIA